MLSAKPDEELMVAYQLGEAEAFEVLYARHAPKVLGFLRKKLGNEAQARDVFQATFLKLHRCRERYDAGFPFLPWLFTICRNELLDAVKRAHAKNETPMASVPEPEITEETSTELPPIDLSPLPEAQREALRFRYREDFSFQEIAARLDTSPANARQLVSRALRTLRRIYGK